MTSRNPIEIYVGDVEVRIRSPKTQIASTTVEIATIWRCLLWARTDHSSNLARIDTAIADLVEIMRVGPDGMKPDPAPSKSRKPM